MATIDMTHTHWGHNYFSHRRVTDNSWRASIISTPPAKNGDVVLIPQKSGKIGHYKVSHADRPRDPGDFVNCTLTFDETSSV